MNTILKLTALAASMAVASAQTYTNGTTAPSVGSVAGYQYLGCFSLATTGFTSLQTSSAMTDELCASFAVNFPYFAVSGTVCLGGASINSTRPAAQSSCNTRCPGNPLEICGGSSVATAKRQAVTTFYSVYQQVNIAAGQVVNQVITNVYVDINLNLGTLQTVTAVSTAAVTGCGCPTQVIPTIPCTTTTVYCSVCATPGPVTVTVPAGVTAGSAAAPTVTVAAGSAAAAAAAAAGAGSAAAGAGSAAAPGSAAAAAAAASASGSAAAAAAAAAAGTTYTGAASQNIISGAAAVGALVAVLAL